MFIGSSVSTSPTFAGVAGAAISNGAGKAVKFDANGEIILCATAGEAAIGILILQTADAVAKGDSVTVQLSGRGQGIAGAAIAAGAMVTTDATGKLATAATGNFILGQAMTAGVADGMVHVQITKGGLA